MTARSSTARYRRIIGGFRRARIAVVGDLIADEFLYGEIERVSREAPVLIVRYDTTEVVPGGAGNAANNAAALGAHVEVVGVVGRDEAGRRLLRSLERGASARGVLVASRHVTPVKTRILAGVVHSAKQQVVRVDRAGTSVSPAVQQRVEAALVRAIRRADAIIISDYGYGLITPAVWRRAIAAARVRRAPRVLVDSRHGLMGFAGLMTATTPNESEVEALLDMHIDNDRQVLERAGRALLQRLRCPAVLVTRGSRGMALFEPDKPTDHIPIVGSDQVTDVTGAGDTVIATFTLALTAGASFAEAARIANVAGGLVVMKRGTATVTARELIDALRN
ncbi:MAG TPA: PfkB family carbohydrate kinase [Vicinamibacterales bacterium]|nr:PfkB family carbohydrate kinase [Vicinamibacterales bacterium]